MKLVIFDLDQTLVDFIDIHDETMQELFQRYFGVDASLKEIDFAGKSLTDNITELARVKGIPESEVHDKGKTLLEAYENIFDEKLPAIASDYILPGVTMLLEKLSKTDNIVVLYTGGSSAIVSRVFKATGLGKYFRFCVYGTEVESRVAMAKKAIAKAAKLTGIRFHGKNVVIIGDSIRDVECGKQLNALTVAVATGVHSKADLAKRNPDYLFDDLKDYHKVIEAIGK